MVWCYYQIEQKCKIWNKIKMKTADQYIHIETITRRNEMCLQTNNQLYTKKK